MLGNLIATILSIPTPLFTRLLLIPYLFHPKRWGGYPWSPPMDITITTVSLVINLIIIYFLGTLANMMTTLRECNNKNLALSMKRASWTLLGWIVGSCVIYLLPFLKAPILTFTISFPFAGFLVTGFLVSIFVFIFSEIGSKIIISDVC